MHQVNAYRPGHCPQCQDKIFITNTLGKIVGIKPSSKQTYITMEDGHRFKCILCEKCFNDPDLEMIWGSIKHDRSKAGGLTVKSKINRYDKAISIQEAR